MAVVIAVYADWDGLPAPRRLGWLHANRTRGREVFEFEFDPKALSVPKLANPRLDPRLGLFEGRQPPAHQKPSPSIGTRIGEHTKVLVTLRRMLRPAVDLAELWSRIVFNVLVSNTDDHLRNHGFIMQPGKGWLLSEVYDMNPVASSNGLGLNISESDNSCDLDLVRSVAPYFRVDTKAAARIVERFTRVVRQWPKIAGHIGISARARDRMASAFRLAE